MVAECRLCFYDATASQEYAAPDYPLCPCCFCESRDDLSPDICPDCPLDPVPSTQPLPLPPSPPIDGPNTQPAPGTPSPVGTPTPVGTPPPPVPPTEPPIVVIPPERNRPVEILRGKGSVLFADKPSCLDGGELVRGEGGEEECMVGEVRCCSSQLRSGLAEVFGLRSEGGDGTEVAITSVTLLPGLTVDSDEGGRRLESVEYAGQMVFAYDIMFKTDEGRPSAAQQAHLLLTQISSSPRGSAIQEALELESAFVDLSNVLYVQVGEGVSLSGSLDGEEGNALRISDKSVDKKKEGSVGYLVLGVAVLLGSTALAFKGVELLAFSQFSLKRNSEEIEKSQAGSHPKEKGDDYEERGVGAAPADPMVLGRGEEKSPDVSLRRGRGIIELLAFKNSRGSAVRGGSGLLDHESTGYRRPAPRIDLSSSGSSNSTRSPLRRRNTSGWRWGQRGSNLSERATPGSGSSSASAARLWNMISSMDDDALAQMTNDVEFRDIVFSPLPSPQESSQSGMSSVEVTFGDPSLSLTPETLNTGSSAPFSLGAVTDAETSPDGSRQTIDTSSSTMSLGSA
ncbi:unnamed protein product [Chrysoparadoxa australica]